MLRANSAITIRSFIETKAMPAWIAHLQQPSPTRAPIPSPLQRPPPPFLLRPLLLRPIPQEHFQHAEIVTRLHRARHHERDPELPHARQPARHHRAHALTQRLHDIHHAHDCRALGRQDRGSKERLTRRLIHGLRRRPQYQKRHGEADGRRQGNESQADGGGEMREDHGLDEADALGDGRGDEVGGRGDEVRDEEEGPQRAFGEAELAVEEVRYPRSGHETRGHRVDGEEQTELREDRPAFGTDLRPDAFLCFRGRLGLGRGRRWCLVRIGVLVIIAQEAFGFDVARFHRVVSVLFVQLHFAVLAQHKGQCEFEDAKRGVYAEDNAVRACSGPSVEALQALDQPSTYDGTASCSRRADQCVPSEDIAADLGRRKLS